MQGVLWFGNIELKNSVICYKEIGKKVIDLVIEYGLEPYIIYSSLLSESMGLIKEIQPDAKTAILAGSILEYMKGVKMYRADALHPYIFGLDINQDFQKEEGWKNIPVRAWNGDEPFFGQKRKLSEVDLRKSQIFGVTDIITNVPENYL